MNVSLIEISDVQTEAMVYYSGLMNHASMTYKLRKQFPLNVVTCNGVWPENLKLNLGLCGIWFEIKIRRY